MIRSIFIATPVATALVALPALAAGEPGATHRQAVEFAKGKSMAAVWIAPVGKRRVMWATIAVILVTAGYFGNAGNAASLFVAALVEGVLAVAAIRRWLLIDV